MNVERKRQEIVQLMTSREAQSDDRLGRKAASDKTKNGEKVTSVTKGEIKT